MRFVQVCFELNLSKFYEYRIPDNFSVVEGCRVMVPLKKFVKPAFVVSISSEKQYTGELESVISVREEIPIIPSSLFRLALWMSKYYVCPLGQVLEAIIPSSVRADGELKQDRKISIKDREGLINYLKTCKSSHKIKIRVCEFLLKNPCSFEKIIHRECRSNSKHIDELLDIGVIESKKETVYSTVEELESVKADIIDNLTDYQKNVLEKIFSFMNKNHSVHLIQGVTGCGKTEIYIRLIEETLKNGKTGIVLVPEISLTPQMVRRFRRALGEKLAVLHSSLGERERLEQWHRLRNKTALVAIGARSAIFAPVENLGIIIIDEEHSNSYKQGEKPRYSAVNTAIKRAEIENALVVCGSATPSIEFSYRARERNINFYEIPVRIDNRDMPEISIVDMRVELEQKNFSMFSRDLQSAMHSVFSQKKNVLIFLNRRGYSPFVLCRSCGESCKCQKCSVSLTYHADTNKLLCHYCGYQELPPQKCFNCGSPKIKHFGSGTQRIEEEIKKKFGNIPVFRMDRDSTSRKNAHLNILRQFEKTKGGVLLGTQMVVSGLDFESIALVGILSADLLTKLPDFRSGERAFSLLTQASGRTGRGRQKGRVIVQTYSPHEEILQYAKNHDYNSFYENELKIRKMLLFPPFSTMAYWMFEGGEEETVKLSCTEVAELLRKYELIKSKKIEVIGPVQPLITKIEGKYRYSLILRCFEEPSSSLGFILTDFLKDEFDKIKISSKIKNYIDIDPVSML